ncbi:MAG: CPBP family intramembrane metalloprotease [Myxococcota bacterium]|nr:CPBP family intramembrane metalloprotease [Myxococcota bacterium]
MTNDASPIRWHAALGYVLLAVTASFATQLLAALVRMSQGLDLQDAAAAVQRDPTSLGLSQLLGFALTLAIARRLHAPGPRREVYALLPTSRPGRRGQPPTSRPGRRGQPPTSSVVVIFAGLAGLALQLPLAEIGNLVHALIGRDLAHARAVHDLLRVDSAWDGFALTLALVVIAPITEELLFRGVLLRGLVRSYGERVGLFVCAVLFGLLHGRPAEALVAFVAGLVLGALRLRTRSVLPCIALHVGVNALPVLVPAELLPIPGVNVLGDEILHVPPLKVAAAAVVAGVALFLALRFDRED